MKSKVILSFFLIFGFFVSKSSLAQWGLSYICQYPGGPSSNSWLVYNFATKDTGFLVENRYYSPSVGYSYTRHKTTDGGQSWQDIGTMSGHYMIDLFAVDPDTLFFIESTFMFDDFGGSFSGGYWESLYTFSGPYLDMPCDLFMINGHTGYILTYPGASGPPLLLYKYFNDSTSLVYHNDTLHVNEYSKLFFVNADLGFLTAYRSDGKWFLLKTQDGAISWASKTPHLEGRIFSIFFTSDSVGYLGCENGRIFKTLNQGATWDTLSTGTDEDIYCIHFANDSVGAFCGENIVLKKTNDAGLTWTVGSGGIQQGGYKTSLNNIQMFDFSTGFVVRTVLWGDCCYTLYREPYPIGIDTITRNASLTLFPNPVNNELNVRAGSSFPDKISFKMFNQFSQQVLTGQVPNPGIIDCRSLPNGLYFIKFVLSGSTMIRKVIKTGK